MNWYVIYTRPRWESKIYKALLEQGIEAYCPAYSVLRQFEAVPSQHNPAFRFNLKWDS
ncbi:transcription termination/antitermination NusG family protein [Bacteroidota bacterium]